MSRILSHNQTHANNSAHPQIKKIFCAYHPNEFLTNFCCDMECLMPLCPNCIVEHTEQHFLQNNKPTYVNVNEAINETKQKCYQNIIMFQELNKANDKVYDYVMGLRESIHNQLMEDKQDIYRQIDLLFEQYEEKLFNETVAHYRQLEVYDRKQTANISSFITEQIQIIHEQINVLKGENCLAGLINYYKNDGKVYEDSIKQISEYIQKHKRAGKISINGDQEKLRTTLQNFCEQNLQVEFINDQSARDEQRMKTSNVSRENKSLSHKLSMKHVTPVQSEVYNPKENNFNLSNQDYRAYVKRSQDYYKIDPMELKTAKHNSGSFSRQVGTRHRY